MYKWLNKGAAAIIICMMIVCLLPIPAAQAHAYVANSYPKQEEELTTAPDHLHVTFTEDIDTKLSSVSIVDEKGNVVSAKQSAAGDRTLMLTGFKLADGVYTVKWQSLSVDTHVTEDSFRFAVGVKLKKTGPSDTVSLDDEPAAGSGTSGGSKPDKPKEPVKKPEQKPGAGTDKPASSNGAGKDQKPSGSKSETAGGKPVQSKPGATTKDKEGNGTKNANNIDSKKTEQSGNSKEALSGSGSKPAENVEAGSEAGDQGDQSKSASSQEPSAQLDPSQASKETTAKPDGNGGVPPGSEGVSGTVSTPGASTSDSSVSKGGNTDAASNQAAGSDNEATAQEQHVHVHNETAHQHDTAAGSGAGLKGGIAFLRIIDILAIVLLGSVFLFRDWIFIPLEERGYSASRWFSSWLYTVVAAVLAISGALRLYDIGSQLSGIGTAEAIGHLLGTTMLGWMTLTRIGLALVIAISMALKLEQGAWRVIRVILYAGLALTFPLTGHAYSPESGLSLMVWMHVLHIVVTAVWCGGLTGLLLVSIKPADTQRSAFLQRWNRMLLRFAQLALPMMIAAGISGVALALNKIASWQGLLNSTYGTMVIAKVMLFALVLVLAAYHRYALMPKLASAASNPELAESSWSGLIGGIRLELFLALLLFIAAGLLSSSPPPIG
ncbi:copper resistance protein CopC [Paenibacillus sp. UMB4589-SE434]|uniref:copper resistance protein CopC n=1 Tax=Paenibacillus sp. UMB4589-SE434 TaxID=3046314 RepID=UPI002550EB77|nr:copper resistance protein CopC [Paenibacillus sp. UMB4589-SE434]MDK8182373.1 copper resistance protein CopC [Paenibacillus sp. UMB4589-SE434]